MSAALKFGYVVETVAGFIVSIGSAGEVMVSHSMQEAMRVTIDFAHSPLLDRVSARAMWLVPYGWDGKE